MGGEPSPALRLLRAFRARERAFVVAYLLAFGVAAAAFSMDSVRTALFEKLEAGLVYWDDRWTRRTLHGEELLRAGRLEEAVRYLERLDAVFPAPHAKYRRDLERERVLRALGEAHARLGHKRRSLDAFRRLVAFDPRNFDNHYRLGRALVGFAEPEAALESFRRALAIHPSHLESLREVVRIHADRGDDAAVAANYERYLDAYRLAPLEVSLGDARARARVPVDGRPHEIEVRLQRPPRWSGRLEISPGAQSIAILRATLHPGAVVGRQSSATPPPVWDAGAPWAARGLARVGAGLYRPFAGPRPDHLDTFDPLVADTALRVTVPAQPDGVAGVRIRLRMFKPIDRELWAMVRRSYRNLVDWERMAAAEARTLPSESSDAG